VLHFFCHYFTYTKREGEKNDFIYFLIIFSVRLSMFNTPPLAGGSKNIKN